MSVQVNEADRIPFEDFVEKAAAAALTAASNDQLAHWILAMPGKKVEEKDFAILREAARRLRATVQP